MRYIRTKDGIYRTDYHNDEQGYYITTDYQDFKDNEVKVADTIEELCDEFVVKYFNGTEFYAGNGVIKNEIIHTWYELLHWRETGLYIGNYKAIFYGAIWTDKGLIYVAKINEKGELELL